MELAIVIVTHNGRQYLPQLFSSLDTTQDPGVSWGVIVVDNASTDGTREELSKVKSQKSKVYIIENEVNVGFAAGNNQGIERAFAMGARFVVLLNQDTVVDPHWLLELVRAAEGDSKIGAVQARLMLWDTKDIVNSIGNEIHFLGFGYAGSYGENYNLSPITYHLKEITYPSGAAVLLKREALEDIGLLDESFFMYHEDLDLGWRLWMAGWTVMLAPDAVVYHKYSFSKSIQKYYYMERNRFLVLLELYRFPTLVLIAPAFLAMEVGLLLKSFFSGWWKEKLKGYIFFLNPKTWVLILRKRHEKQAHRRVPDRQIVSRFTGRIEFQEFSSPLVTFIVNPLFNLYWQIAKRIIWW